ncbi:tyrosine-type recombinase/integrase [Loigolactobacillus bifermentans]|uniref:Tyr recombinase domain-containing protein n=1 Tax=Loigolactobacillus bifermentans DSM 20003 TaxID=1423726 RepID=A0A0R1H0I3_9LACO|nr:site-specific integrase [Loigolactobacillus bifermentans]KRK39989.1 hypothetical protein FC07_GL001787 [Loigolactobacillus bifermentans DSM 20003]QGG59687.1 tyrosine-type recombinase/integrase [Loigolactobacillus bifermentans]
MAKITYTKTKKESVYSYETGAGKKLYRVRFKKLMINGKYKQITKNSFKTIAEAVAYRDKASKEADKALTGNSDITVGEYYKQYRERKIKANEWSADTQRGTQYYFDYLVLPHYAKTKIKALNRAEYQTYINYLLYDREDPLRPGKTKPLCNATVKVFNKVFQAFVKSAIADELIDHNRLIKIAINKDEPRVKRDLTMDELERALTDLKQHSTTMSFIMCYLPILGMRRGEVIGLRYGDITPSGPGLLAKVHRARTTSKPDGTNVKTESSYRTIYIDGEPAKQLKIAVKEFLRIKKMHKAIPHQKDFIFISERTGKPYHPNTMTVMYNRCGKRIGVWPLHPHMMRHTFATQSAMASIDSELVSQYMGHKNLRMTNAYKEPTLEGKARVASVMSKQFEAVNRTVENLGVNEV